MTSQETVQKKGRVIGIGCCTERIIVNYWRRIKSILSRIKTDNETN